MEPYKESVRRSVLREGTRTRWLTLVASAFVVFALALAAWAGLHLAGGGADPNAAPPPAPALHRGQLQLEPLPDPDAEPDANDYLVLLSDGAANRPADVDESGAQNDFYIDVNDNG